MRNFNKPEKLTDKDKALLRYVDNVKKNDPATMKMIAEYNPLLFALKLLILLWVSGLNFI